jgi:hypothetical protein
MSSNEVTSGSGETSIQVITFSGRKDDWESWKEKVMIKAAILGYESIVMSEDKAPNTHNPNNGRKLVLKEDEQEILDMNKKG